MKEAIAEELRLLRIRNNLKVEDVAKDFGINKETIYRFESSTKNSKTYISTKKLEAFLNYYKENPEDFLQNVIKNIKRKRMN